jgi:hypothetical protein
VTWNPAKDEPSDPDWWYEMRRVDSNGDPVSPLAALFGQPSHLQWRRRTPEEIARMEAAWTAAYLALPVLGPVFRCAKCAFEERSIVYQVCEEFGERSVMHITCQRCRAVSHAKPLDWEVPI